MGWVVGVVLTGGGGWPGVGVSGTVATGVWLTTALAGLVAQLGAADREAVGRHDEARDDPVVGRIGLVAGVQVGLDQAGDAEATGT